MRRAWLFALLVACRPGPPPPSRPPPPSAPRAPVAEPARPADAEIAAMLRAVDPRRIEADVRALAAFGTRHSLSDTTSDSRGIGAASRWLLARFEAIAPLAGGRLRARREPFTAPKGPRIPEDWPMHNVVAELVARPTTAPLWTDHFDAGGSGRFAVALSKDNWHFGLRAVDDAGHASLTVYPLPLKEGEPWPP